MQNYIDDTDVDQTPSTVIASVSSKQESIKQKQEEKPVLLPEILDGTESQIPSLNPHEKTQSTADSEIFFNAAERFKKNDFEGTISLLKELSARDKRAFTLIGISYFKLSDYRNSLDYLKKAVEHEAHNFIALKFLAFSYYKVDDLENSFRIAEAGLAVKQDKELLTFYNKVRREKQTQQGYLQESTLHFKVLFDGYEHGRTSREIISILEDAYRHIGREMNYFPSEPVTIILYTGADFFDITQAPMWSGGVFDGKIRIPIRGAEGQSELLRRVLFHEYAHAVVYSITQRCPLWVNEGIAEYFSRAYPKKIGQVIPLYYLHTSFSGLRGDYIAIAYWESYSAVSYLIEKYGMNRIKDLLFSLSKDGDIDKAFRDAFNITYKEFVEQWGRKQP